MNIICFHYRCSHVYQGKVQHWYLETYVHFNQVVFKRKQRKLLQVLLCVFHKVTGQQLFEIQHYNCVFSHQDEKCLRINNFSG